MGNISHTYTYSTTIKAALYACMSKHIHNLPDREVKNNSLEMVDKVLGHAFTEIGIGCVVAQRKRHI